jgi:hypothetical protein
MITLRTLAIKQEGCCSKIAAVNNDYTSQECFITAAINQPSKNVNKILKYSPQQVE